MKSTILNFLNSLKLIKNEFQKEKNQEDIKTKVLARLLIKHILNFDDLLN